MARKSRKTLGIKLRVYRERIDRVVNVYERGQRQTSKKGDRKRNPEIFELARMGSINAIAYPGSNPERVYLAVEGVLVQFELDDFIRFFNRLSQRARAYRRLLRKGGKNQTKAKSRFDKSINAGIKGHKRV